MIWRRLCQRAIVVVGLVLHLDAYKTKPKRCRGALCRAPLRG